MHNPRLHLTQGVTALLRSDVRHYLASRPTVGEPCAADWQVRYAPGCAQKHSG